MKAVWSHTYLKSLMMHLMFLMNKKVTKIQLKIIYFKIRSSLNR